MKQEQVKSAGWIISFLKSRGCQSQRRRCRDQDLEMAEKCWLGKEAVTRADARDTSSFFYFNKVLGIMLSDAQQVGLRQFPEHGEVSGWGGEAEEGCWSREIPHSSFSLIKPGMEARVLGSMGTATSEKEASLCQSHRETCHSHLKAGIALVLSWKGGEEGEGRVREEGRRWTIFHISWRDRPSLVHIM